MMRVLIVRISSMGDLVHTLPALTDAARAIPGLCFDWVVDEAFAEVPAWHASVETVMPSAFRRWRRDPRAAWQSGEPREFLRQVRRRHYDLVVDVQCELKSAFAARLARGVRYGYDSRTVHEWGAQFAYHKRFAVAKGQHSIQRMRQLLAAALNYSFDAAVIDYGVDRARLPPVSLALPAPYLVYIHSTSWASKNWPVAYWQELTRRARAAGYAIVLPWGTETERQRALEIAANDVGVVVLPPLSISEKATIIGGALATVGLDTGLSHIAAALDIPSVTIYGATDPNLCGTVGRNQVQVISDFECVRCHQTRCTYPGAVQPIPSCLVGVRPEQVWQELESLLHERVGANELSISPVVAGGA